MTAGPWAAEVIEWDEGNEGELWAHGIIARDVYDVWGSGPKWVPNKKHRAGDWKMLGRNRHGQRLTIIVRYYSQSRTIRPITGWLSTKSEISKYY